MLSLLWLLVVGLIAGLLARALVPGKDSMSLVATLLLGVSGSVVGGLVLGLLFGGFRDRGFSPAGIIGSVIGAVIVLLVYNRISGRRASGTTARRGTT
ncbi:GlsB/YeaQ/YmgE family stress response membrane protein [Blastococcus sp. PRF04-17]|uniref:GlsB/YeaQ/YmgE family stress response membrane protein n=1 Tax=Blastococcus sp. PRF04-17 TaxID=2933797 RepID=UPI001FF157DC|nr:GlsB/YeaQ/YmgE family stress response membrane protein [Blastococcus sp. PRF04-17]UOY02966.1 GlsB/YeaQ/YmgE family stress response membrane protein [Blastococcus sp. PRF04-17]